MPLREIFSPFGSVNRSKLTLDTGKKPVAFVTLSEVGGKSWLTGYAPVTGVGITQLTDFSITKSLDKDFLVAVFGDTPVKIVLRGVNFFNLNGCNLGSGRNGKKQVMSFYKSNRLSTAPQKRFDVAITVGADSTPVVFRCVIVGLETQNASTESGISNIMYSYTMQLIGVDRN